MHVLAKLDQRDFVASLEKAKANSVKASADLARSQQLFEKQATSLATLEQHEQVAAVAKADLALATKALEDTVLRSPFSGRVASKLIEDFANITAKQQVFVIHDYSELMVKVNVPERDFVNAASVENLDTSCIEATLPVPFFLTPAGPAP